MAQTGTALLPLHYGRVPPWLATRMASLGRVITEAIVLEYGRDEFLERLAHPYWFQALGAVMGMDWHSSGITTSVLGALKRGLAPVQWELGIHVCGGRGSESRKTPAEVTGLCERLGLDGEALVRASRLVAKVDSAAVQDGYDLYLHGFILADDGRWAAVQQGMNGERRDARRYHWLSERVTSFVDAPHAAIDGRPQPDPIVNLTDRRADAARVAQLALVGQGPGAIAQAIVRHRSAWRERAATGPVPSELRLPFHHDVRAEDVIGRRLHGALSAAHARAPADFAELLLTPGVGPRTVFALALVGEVVHGAPARFRDPARFSLAHGGKDGHPYPVPRRVYDQTIRVLKSAVERAKLGQADKLSAIRRLDAEARRLERFGPSANLDTLVASEWDHSAEWDGATAAGPVPADPAARNAMRRAIGRSVEHSAATRHPPPEPAQLDLALPA
jgi:hypothetical protein